MRRRCVLAVVLGLVLTFVAVPAADAHEPTPSLTITDVVLAPGAGGVVDQVVTYTDMPENSVMQFQIPLGFGFAGAQVEGSQPVGTGCAGGDSAASNGYGDCFYLMGSGTVRIHFKPAEVPRSTYIPSVAAGQTTVLLYLHPEVTATGSVTLTPRADLAVSVESVDEVTAIFWVTNYGPSFTGTATLTVSGDVRWAQDPDSTACTASGSTLTCNIGAMSATAETDGCDLVDTLYACAGLMVVLPSERVVELTAHASGATPDPNSSNNSAVAFPGARPPASEPPPVLEAPPAPGKGDQAPPPAPAKSKAHTTTPIATATAPPPSSAEPSVSQNGPASTAAAVPAPRSDAATPPIRAEPLAWWPYVAVAGTGTLVVIAGLIVGLLIARKRRSGQPLLGASGDADMYPVAAGVVHPPAVAFGDGDRFLPPPGQ